MYFHPAHRIRRRLREQVVFFFAGLIDYNNFHVGSSWKLIDKLTFIDSDFS